MNTDFDVKKSIIEYEKLYPHKIAIQYENETITYGELARRVRALLWQLQEAGVKKGDIIAVGIFNSIELIVSIYSILCIRAVVLPIDIMLPFDRIKRIFIDSQPKYILCKKESQSIVSKLDVKSIYVDARLENGNKEESNYCMENRDEDEAFCIYTSGTTGKPKGVLLNYKGIINHAIAKINLLSITSESKLCLSFSVEFVAAIWQIMVPLLCAANLVIYNRNLIKVPYQFFKQIEEDKITVVAITPHTLQGYLEYLKNRKNKLLLSDLTYIVLTGEKLNSYLVKRFYEQYSSISLINAYGQTECSDDTYHYIIPNTFSDENVPIGTPILNMKGFVLNENLYESNIGELYIGGVGVAKGYLYNKKLTEKKFIKTSLFPTPLYKTGDWVKMDSGMLIYLGRIDNQVKIRGYRVELEEIENCINTYKGIENCLVREIYINENDKMLEAIYVASEIIEKNLLKNYLASRLPEYMIPNKFTRIEKFTYTVNGKIDRKNTFNEIEYNNAVNVVNELNELQLKILKVITSFLRENIFQDISLDDDLSSIGIDSITYVKMVVTLEKAFDFEFDNEKLLATVFTTIRDIINYVTESIEKGISNSE